MLTNKHWKIWLWLLQHLANFICIIWAISPQGRVSAFQQHYTLSRAATNPASLLNAVSTNALYFWWTSRIVSTYTLGSCRWIAMTLQNTKYNLGGFTTANDVLKQRIYHNQCFNPTHHQGNDLFLVLCSAALMLSPMTRKNPKKIITLDKLTLKAWSPHFSKAFRSWLVMWFSSKVRSCPSPSGILATKLYMRPRSKDANSIKKKNKNNDNYFVSQSGSTIGAHFNDNTVRTQF